ncbi:MAG: ABC transporter permease [Hungatella sp.]|nr:ABC transporter permease [Hungatella sp.]
MINYILKRIGMMIPVLMGVSLLVFTLLHFAPGDPARIMLGDDAPVEAIEAKREELGLKDPFITQYVRYVTNIVTKGDFGNSFKSGQPVAKLIMERYPTTLKMAGACLVMMIVMGLPIGIVSAVKQYSLIDNLAVTIGLVAVSMPNFWLGMVLIILFSVKLRLLPASGFYGWKYWILPAMTVGFSNAAGLLRTTRSSMLECIRQDYVVTARAKGQKESYVILHHVLRNALLPIFTVVGISFGIMLGGAIVTEQIFSIPGIGKLMIDSINSRDYPVVQGAVLLVAFSFSIINLSVDILYSLIDPRIKIQGKKKERKEEHKEVEA